MCEPDLDAVVALLRRWALGEIDVSQAQAEAERLWCACEEWPDYPKWDRRSAVVEALGRLDTLNHELIVKEDIPAFLRFLGAEHDSLLQAWLEWDEYWEQVDWEARERELKGNPHYAL